MTKFPTITEFFSGRDIFITGGSGFMGKALIEKLLRSCPGINKIFVLIRPKKGVSTSERLDKLKEESVFIRLRQENPKMLNKLVPISGDVSSLQLGLSKESIKLMENVSVIFHSAASVRFDDSLKDAVILNTRGTREVCRFAESLKKLAILLHVSTTYSNCEIMCIKEEMYPPKADWADTIRIVETLDDAVINALTLKYMDFAANTYTYSKSLGEHVVHSFKDRIPSVIFRPSIVIGAMDEPMPGWLDNFNGPIGLLVAGGIGLSRINYTNPDIIPDYTPVDIAIKSMIGCAWRHGCKKITDFKVYNCSTSSNVGMSNKDLAENGVKLSKEIPFDNLLWAASSSATKNRQLYSVLVLILHMLPAVILDQLLKMSGKKPFLAKLHRKIYTANMFLETFLLNQWTFKNENFMSIGDDIMEQDRVAFQFNDFASKDLIAYLRAGLLGAKRYLLHQKDENIPKAIKKSERFILADRILKTSVLTFLAYFFFVSYGSYIGFTHYSNLPVCV